MSGEKQPTTSRSTRRPVNEVYVHDASSQSSEHRSTDRRARVLTGVGLAGVVALTGGVAYIWGRNDNPDYISAAPTPTAAGMGEPTPSITFEPTQAPTLVPTEAPTASPSEAPTASPTMAPTEVPSVVPTETPSMPIAIDNAKLNADGTWALTNPDGQPEALQSVEGFIPDASLVLAPEWGNTLNLNPSRFADFQASLNDPDHPLVGYTYGFNDESDNLNYTRTLQAPMYSWTVLTGEEVSVPGIGRLVGGPGRAVELMIMNLDGSVADFGPDNPVFVKHGFIGTGRIWDGDNVVEAERGISSHYVNRLREGVTLPDESGFIGQCDIAENCNEVLVVAVLRTQWGFNEDGTKRFQYQLLRSEIFTK